MRVGHLVSRNFVNSNEIEIGNGILTGILIEYCMLNASF